MHAAVVLFLVPLFLGLPCNLLQHYHFLSLYLYSTWYPDVLNKGFLLFCSASPPKMYHCQFFPPNIPSNTSSNALIFGVLFTRYLSAADVPGYSGGCRLSKRLSCLNRGHDKRDAYTIISLTPRRYNPWRILADSIRRLQPSLSLALILQVLTPNLSASLITPSIHLRSGLPARLLPSGLSKVIFLHSILSCIRIICPAHLNLAILIVSTRSVSSYRQYSS